MKTAVDIFWDFQLPNATTWFYFSFLLAVALFFKFSRFFSIRNCDVFAIFLLVPGLLLLAQARQIQHTPPLDEKAVASLVGNSGMQIMSAPTSGVGGLTTAAANPHQINQADHFLWIGYLWLLVASGVLVFRCFLDLILEQRPALMPNLNSGGMVWLGLALFICLSVVAFRPPNPASFTAPRPQPSFSEEVSGPEDRTTAPLELAQSPFEPSFYLMRSFSLLCHLSVIGGLIVVGIRHYQNLASGMAAATFYLLLPYTGYFFGQAYHVWPMALMIWAVVFYRHPTLAGIFMGLAAGTVFFPALLLPVWVGFYWRRGAGRFTVVALLSAGACLAITGLILWLHNDLASIIVETLALPDWQPWKIPTREGIWTDVHWAYRMPVFILFLTLVLLSGFWPCPKNLAHVLAMSTIILLGIQFWYADQGGIYVLWYLPFFLLMVFRPNLRGRRPPNIEPEADWLTRLLGWIKDLVTKLFKAPADTVAKVSSS